MLGSNYMYPNVLFSELHVSFTFSKKCGRAPWSSHICLRGGGSSPSFLLGSYPLFTL